MSAIENFRETARRRQKKKKAREYDGGEMEEMEEHVSIELRAKAVRMHEQLLSAREKATSR